MLWGCQKNPFKNLLPEDQVVDPLWDGCTWKGKDLSHYWLVGKRKLERAKIWLLSCENEGLIQRFSKEIKDQDAFEAGVTCYSTPVILFQLIHEDDLSRVERDLVNCRDQKLIRELQE
jgi:hypothetical protein